MKYLFWLSVYFILINVPFSKSKINLQDLEDEEVKISCTCGKQIKEWKKRLDLFEAMDIFDRTIGTDINAINLFYYPNVVKEYFKECSSCEIMVTKCNDNEESVCNKSLAKVIIQKNETFNNVYKDLVSNVMGIILFPILGNGGKKVHIVKRNTLHYPVHVHIPIGGLSKRSKRHARTCHYPKNLQTAELNCIHYPSKVICRQRCAHGSMLKGLVQMDFKCNHKENKWRPGNFKECQPFVDCTVTLISGGKSRCTHATLKKSPTCEIKCDKYEDKKKIGYKKYSCDLRGNWSPPLPFCAHAGSGYHLEDYGQRNYASDED